LDAIVLRTFDEPVSASAETSFVAKICGRERADGMWEGWVEFVPRGGSPILRSHRETTQPNRRLMEDWASRLSQTYLQGCLERTLRAEKPQHRPQAPMSEPPHFDGPAPSAGSRRRPAPDDAGLNPFLHYKEGPDALTGKLEELSANELRIVARAYDLDAGTDGLLDLDALDRRDLTALIEGAVRARMLD